MQPSSQAISYLPETQSPSVLRPASSEQMAEIKRLSDLIETHGAEINRPYVMALAVLITTLGFSYLFAREDAPFSEQYINFLDKFSANFVSLPEEYKPEAVTAMRVNFEDNFKKLDKGCLSYYEFSKKGTELTNGMLSAFNKAMGFSEPSVKDNVERFLKGQYGEEGVRNIRNECEKFIRSVHNLLEREGMVSNLRDMPSLSDLSLELIFKTAENHKEWLKTVLLPTGIKINRVGREVYTSIFARLFTAAKWYSYLAASKMGAIGISQKVFYLLLNRVVPRGFHPQILDYCSPRELRGQIAFPVRAAAQVLSDKEAAKHIVQLETYEAQRRKIAYFSARFTRNIGLLLSFTAFILLLAFGVNGIAGVPGELTFFLVATLAAASYSSVINLKRTYDKNRVEKKIDAVESLLQSKFEFFKVEKIGKALQLAAAQFSFQIDSKTKKIHPADVRIILSRCLKKAGIPIITADTWPVVIGNNNAITTKIEKTTRWYLPSFIARYLPTAKNSNIAIAQEQFICGVERVVEINRFNDDLKKLQKELSKESYSECEKTFADDGLCDAVWYLFCDKRSDAQRVQKLLGEKNCTLQEQEDGQVVINILNVGCLELNKLQNFIQGLRREKTVTKDEKDEESSFVDVSAPSATLGAIPRSTKKVPGYQEEPTKEESKRVPFRTLPHPYENAKRIQAPYLPTYSHLWALFEVDEKDVSLPTQKSDECGETKNNPLTREDSSHFDESLGSQKTEKVESCHKTFQRLFDNPKIVPPKASQGLVHDDERSRPGDCRYKAKTLGFWNAVRALDDEVRKITVVPSADNPEQAVNSTNPHDPQRSEETIHIFRTVILAHT